MEIDYGAVQPVEIIHGDITAKPVIPVSSTRLHHRSPPSSGSVPAGFGITTVTLDDTA